MLRCQSCNGILTKAETVCFSCGEAAPGQGKDKPAARNRFALVIKVVFFLSVALTGFSLFSDGKVPFPVCLAATVVLLFAKRSSEQLSNKNQG